MLLQYVLHDCSNGKEGGGCIKSYLDTVQTMAQVSMLITEDCSQNLSSC